MNIEMFVQYLFFLRISRRALFDVSETYYHNRTNRINWYVHENLAVQVYLLMLDVRKSSWAKICTFT